MSRLDLHVAFAVPGCAEARPAGVAVTSRVGPFIEGVAERVRRVTILGYDVPENPLLEDRVDTVVRFDAGEVDLLSLGPRGSVRDWPTRRRHVRRVVSEASADWDVLVFLLSNRRAGLVLSGNRCPRIAAQIGGFTPRVVWNTPMSPARKAAALVASTAAQVTYWRIGRRSGRFFANGEEILDLYRRWVPHAELLRTSARREQFQFLAEDRLVDPEAPRLLVLGRVAAAKGVFEAMECFALLRNGPSPRAHLDVVGVGPELDELKRAAVRLGVDDAVTWHGWVTQGPEMTRLLSACDVMLLPTRAESLPNTIWEVQAHSVLVVTTSVGSIPRAFTDGHDLLLVPSAEPSELFAAVRRLQGDAGLRRRLLESGRQAAGRVTVEAIAGEFVDSLLARWPELAGAPR